MPQAREIISSDGTRPGVNSTGVDIPGQRIVQLDVSEGPDEVELATAASDPIYGVTLNVLPDGGAGDVVVGSGQKAIIESIGAIGIGDQITAGAAGLAAVAGSDNDFIIGTAITLAGGANVDIEVELVAPGTQRGA